MSKTNTLRRGVAAAAIAMAAVFLAGPAVAQVDSGGFYTGPLDPAGLAKLDAKNGFQSWKFGSPMTAQAKAHVSARSPSGKVVMCDVDTEVYGMNIQGTDTVSVRLFYCSNRLCRIDLPTPMGDDRQSDQRQGLSNMFKAAYGNRGRKLAWMGSKVSLLLEDDGHATFNSLPLAKLLDSAMASEKSAQDAKDAQQDQYNKDHHGI